MLPPSPTCSPSLPQVSRGDVEVLVDTFPGQSIDFFGALRARVYDDKVSRLCVVGLGGLV
jgi:hypothetical protein